MACGSVVLYEGVSFLNWAGATRLLRQGFPGAPSRRDGSSLGLVPGGSRL